MVMLSSKLTKFKLFQKLYLRLWISFSFLLFLLFTVKWCALCSFSFPYMMIKVPGLESGSCVLTAEACPLKKSTLLYKKLFFGMQQFTLNPANVKTKTSSFTKYNVICNWSKLKILNLDVFSISTIWGRNDEFYDVKR